MGVKTGYGALLGAALVFGSGCVSVWGPPQAESSPTIVRAFAHEATLAANRHVTEPAKRSDVRRAPKRKHRRSKRVRVTPEYRKMRAHWHRTAPASLRRRWLAQEVPPMVIYKAGTNERFVLQPLNRDGDFSIEERRKARQAWSYKRTGKNRAIHSRLLKLLYRAMLDFQAPYITLVSGYRPTRKTSRHTKGRAADVVFPGVTEQRLARYFRKKGFVGVGVYPISGFVHVDVRYHSYFWVDRSGPGAPQRRVTILEEVAARYDREAEKRGVKPR